MDVGDRARLKDDSQIPPPYGRIREMGADGDDEWIIVRWDNGKTSGLMKPDEVKAIPSDPWHLLQDLLQTRAVLPGKFELASGRKSDWFIDCKRVILTGEGHALAGELILQHLEECDAVAGVVLGGCALASATTMAAYQHDMDIPALFVRKHSKDHGTERRVEGPIESGNVVLVEDVVTTGASTIRAIKGLSSVGFKVVKVVALVDREEGGREAIRCPFRSIYKRGDFE